MHYSKQDPHYPVRVTGGYDLGQVHVDGIIPVDGSDRMVIGPADHPDAGHLELNEGQALDLYRQLHTILSERGLA